MYLLERNRIITLCIILILALSLVSGCTSREEKIKSFLDKGTTLMEKGEVKKAVLEFKNALQIDPKNAQAWYKLGKAYLADKNPKQAFGCFTNAVEADPELDAARLERAKILVMARQAEAAMEELDKIKEKEKLSPDFELAKARTLMLENRYDEAVEILKKIQDKGFEPRFLMAICYRNSNQPEKLEAAAEALQRDFPDHSATFVLMAEYYGITGKPEKAVEALDRMVEAGNAKDSLKLLRANTLERLGLKEQAAKAYASLPDTLEMEKAKAGFFLRSGELAKAEKILGKIMKTVPEDAAVAMQLARVQVARKDMDAAFDTIESALHTVKDPKARRQLQVLKATLLAAKGDVDQAEKICEKVLEKDQANLDAHALLGRILMAKGKLDQAESHLNQVAIARPKDAEAQLMLARVQLLNKKEAIALDTLKNAVEKNPGNQLIRMNLARLYLARKDRDRAVEVLEKGLEVQPENLVFLRALGEIYASEKQYDKARDYFKKIIDSAPEDPLGYLLMGRLSAAKKDFDKAMDWFRQAYDKKGGWQQALPAMFMVHLAKKDLHGARKLLEAEADKRPDVPMIHYYLGKVLARTGDYDAALKAYQKASELAPNWTAPFQGIAQVYMAQGKIGEAISRLKQAFDKDMDVRSGMALAVLYDLNGQPAQAVAVYEKLLEKYPGSALLLNNLAYLYADSFSKDKQKLEAAKEMIGKVLARATDNPTFLDTAAWVEFKAGNTDAAWTHIQEALNLTKDENPVLNLHAAEIAHARGDDAKARNYLDKVMAQDVDRKSKERAEELMKAWQLQ